MVEVMFKKCSYFLLFFFNFLYSYGFKPLEQRDRFETTEKHIRLRLA